MGQGEEEKVAVSKPARRKLNYFMYSQETALIFINNEYEVKNRGKKSQDLLE